MLQHKLWRCYQPSLDTLQKVHVGPVIHISASKEACCLGKHVERTVGGVPK